MSSGICVPNSFVLSILEVGRQSCSSAGSTCPNGEIRLDCPGSYMIKHLLLRTRIFSYVRLRACVSNPLLSLRLALRCYHHRPAHIRY